MFSTASGLGIIQAAAAIGIAFLYILLSSWVREPDRQKLSAVIVAGAGAAYLNGGLGSWEFIFCALITWLAFKGLRHYCWIGIAWLLHTGWDVLHHLYAQPIVALSPSSSAGCAICDALLAGWFFLKAPTIWNPLGKTRQTT